MAHRLQDIIKSMVELFVEYSDAEGKISKEQMMKMMDKEIECAEMKEKLKAKKCDKNPCDFRDFSCCLGQVAVCCYQKKTGKGQDWEDCSNKC
ncbi:Protein S100-A11 [Dissostichus eleginoides]|uniref:Protein S100-A11 n=1 Tax=Dissostichus eleginoides TaxID=100907 RepID=A0AAD9C725_DISEL|nr:Protein S100-A11 [Dissostichus eleginoides]